MNNLQAVCHLRAAATGQDLLEFTRYHLGLVSALLGVLTCAAATVLFSPEGASVWVAALALTVLLATLTAACVRGVLTWRKPEPELDDAVLVEGLASGLPAAGASVNTPRTRGHAA